METNCAIYKIDTHVRELGCEESEKFSLVAHPE